MEPKAIFVCSRPKKIQKTSNASMPIGAKPAGAPQKKAKPIGARDAPPIVPMSLHQHRQNLLSDTAPAESQPTKAKPIGAPDDLANKASNLIPVGVDMSDMVPIGRVTIRCNATGLPIAQSSSSGASSSIFNALAPPWRSPRAKANPAYVIGRNPNEPPQ